MTMPFTPFPLPALTPPCIPTRSSSTTDSSPITPLSELSHSGGRNSYCTYPGNDTPPRDLTPPPTSRFVPFFKSFKPADTLSTSVFTGDLSRPTSRASSIDRARVSSATGLSRSFSPGGLTLAPVSGYVEPALRSAPIRGSTGSFPLQDSYKRLDSASKLDNVIQGLRHELSIKTYNCETLAAEVSRLKDAYASTASENAHIMDLYLQAQQRIRELELQSFIEDPPHKLPAHSLLPFAPSKPKPSQDYNDKKPHAIRHDSQESRPSTWAAHLRLKQQTQASNPVYSISESAASEESRVVKLPEPAAIEHILTNAPAFVCDLSLVDRFFLDTSFRFANWVKECGLQLPASIGLLNGMSWRDRLDLDNTKLQALGIRNPYHRTYILRVLGSISRGENPGLHLSLTGTDFANSQYPTIMREQRIDKHIPNLASIPWPQRLFLTEEELEQLEVQKAGARGTILTVFSGLRQGFPRPDPRPRRGTKKAKRARNAAGGDEVSGKVTPQDRKPQRFLRASTNDPRFVPTQRM